VHIADDGSPGEHVAGLVELAAGYRKVVTVGTTNAERGGYGRSYNLATQAVHSEDGLVLPLEDDWELRQDLDVDAIADTLAGGGGARTAAIESVRLGYIGFTQALRGTFEHTPAGTMLVLDPESPERHVFAGHPRIESAGWQQRVGPWPEGLAAGQTEFEVAGRPAARQTRAGISSHTSERTSSASSHLGRRDERQVV
jgi:hypothetical protein